MKKNQSKLENSIAKMITDLKAMKSRLNNAEEKVSDLKDKMIKITQSEEQTERQMEKKRK